MKTARGMVLNRRLFDPFQLLLTRTQGSQEALRRCHDTFGLNFHCRHRRPNYPQDRFHFRHYRAVVVVVVVVADCLLLLVLLLLAHLQVVSILIHPQVLVVAVVAVLLGVGIPYNSTFKSNSLMTRLSGSGKDISIFVKL